MCFTFTAFQHCFPDLKQKQKGKAIKGRFIKNVLCDNRQHYRLTSPPTLSCRFLLAEHLLCRVFPSIPHVAQSQIWWAQVSLCVSSPRPQSVKGGGSDLSCWEETCRGLSGRGLFIPEERHEENSLAFLPLAWIPKATAYLARWHYWLSLSWGF